MTIRIGTRRSALARWQAKFVAERLLLADPGLDIRFVHLGSDADRDRQSELTSFGGIGAFTRESETALQNHDVDLVVHSLKDLPTKLAEGLILTAVPEREDPRDVLIGVDIDGLRPGLRVGAGSIRRTAQLRRLCPDLTILPIRGNVPSRLRKARDRKGIDATILAAAGLIRLGLLDPVFDVLDPETFPYAVGQGALGLETRAACEALNALVRQIEDIRARREVDAERSLMATLEAGCSQPVGVQCLWKEDTLTLRACITGISGRDQLVDAVTGPGHDAKLIGRTLGETLIRAGANRLLVS